MRFVKKEPVITTIFNEEIADDDTIVLILESLQKYGVQFSLTVKKYFSYIGEEKFIPYSRVKIKKIHPEERTVDICVVKHSSLATLSNISFDDISEITAITTKNDVFTRRLSSVTRFELLDIKAKES